MMKFSIERRHLSLTLLAVIAVLGALEFVLPSHLASGVPGVVANSAHNSDSSSGQQELATALEGVASFPPTSKIGLATQATTGSVFDPPGGFLGKPLCPSISFGECGPSKAYWLAGYMDQVVSPPTADAVRALISLPSTSGFESDFIQPENYLALGMMAQSQTGESSGCPQTCSSLDYANFAMLYLIPNFPYAYIIGEVWTAPNPLLGESATRMFSKGWTPDPCCLGRSSTMGITMKWNQDTGNLDWIVRLGGVEQTLFSYTPHPTQQKVFHVGTVDQNFVKVKWFQFGVMSRDAPSYPVSPWNAYVASPEYLAGGAWHPVDTASLTYGTDSWVDGGGFTVGGSHLGKLDTCKTGGRFPTSNELLRSGQVIFHYDSGSFPSVLWDSACPKDTVSPTSAFTSPADGTWENSNFGIYYTDSDPGTVATGLEHCYWAVSFWDGVSWVQTRDVSSRFCNFVRGITVGPSSDCPFEGYRSCRVDLWAEDRVGNIGTAVSRYFSIDTVPPSTPSLLSPVNGAVTTNTPTYGWSPSTDATSGITSYILERDTDPAFPVCQSGVPCSRRVILTSSTSYYEDTPLNYGTWYWRVTVGDYAINLAESSTWQFTVSPFVVSASPTSATVLPGATATSTITVTSSSGFSGTVTLSASVSPVVANGPTAIVSPSSISLASGGSSTSSLTISTTSSTPASQYSVTVAGTTGSWSHSAVVSLSVQDFSISASPTTLSVQAGKSGTSTITLTSLGGFSGSVSLTTVVSPLVTDGPAVNPASTSVALASGGSSSFVLLISTIATTPQQTYTIAVTGTSSGLSHQVTVSVSLPDFSISADTNGPDPNSLTLQPSIPAPISIWVGYLNGFTGTVNLTHAVPAGLSCDAITPSSVTDSGTASFSCSSTVVGTYTLTITGTSGTLSHSVTVVVSVTSASFSLSSGCSSSFSMPQGGSESVCQLTITSTNGFSGGVCLEVSVDPNVGGGPIAYVDPFCVHPDATSDLWIGSGATTGDFYITVTADCRAGTCTTPPQTRSLSFNVEIVPPLVASFTYSRANDNLMTQVTFTALHSGGKAPYSYSWDFGDGTFGSGNPVNHMFKKAGTLAVTLTVDDGSGQQVVYSQEILVTMTLHDEFSLDWADYDNSGKVTIVDYATIASYWDKTCSTLAEPQKTYCDYWDFDRNGIVSIVDLSLVAYYFDIQIATGVGAPPYTMSSTWQSRCGELPTSDQPYCMSRGF